VPPLVSFTATGKNLRQSARFTATPLLHRICSSSPQLSLLAVNKEIHRKSSLSAASGFIHRKISSFTATKAFHRK
jgi:hypothetical protein